MEIGKTITWREPAKVKKNGRDVVVGERVVTATIVRERTSSGGTRDYKLDVVNVEGDRPGDVGASIWRHRQRLVKGRSWQRSKEKAGRKR